jgi:hypothetical protein
MKRNIKGWMTQNGKAASDEVWMSKEARPIANGVRMSSMVRVFMFGKHSQRSGLVT